MLDKAFMFMKKIHIYKQFDVKQRWVCEIVSKKQLILNRLEVRRTELRPDEEGIETFFLTFYAAFLS